jgi:hypothetical protein
MAMLLRRRVRQGESRAKSARRDKHKGGDVAASTRERMTLIEPITHEITSPCDFVGAMSGL